MAQNGAQPLVRMGLVGGGPWASWIHAPLLTRSPDIEFVGVWTRRPEAAVELALANGTVAFPRFEELCDQVDALAFCVPPSVQTTLATLAAQRGTALLLEKPVGMTVADAEGLVEAVRDAGVVTQLALTWRYATCVRDFLARVVAAGGSTGRATFTNGVLLGGPFATPWRLAEGPLLDLGPHLVDLFEAALGPVRDLTAVGTSHGDIELRLEHEAGRTSHATLSGIAPAGTERLEVVVETDAGILHLDTAPIYSSETMDRMAEEFTSCVRSGQSHDLDVVHGLHLQRLLEHAAAQLE